MKTVGAAGIAVAAVPGVSSASTKYGFTCGVYIPTLFEGSRDGTIVRPTDIGVINGSTYYDKAIVIPNNSSTFGCNWYGSDCDGYETDIPFSIAWATDAPSGDVGDIILRLKQETPNNDYDGNGWSTYIRDTRESINSGQAVGSLSVRQPIAEGIAANYFQPTKVTLEVDFGDSNLDYSTKTQEYNFCIPNEPQLQTESLLDTSETTYDSGISIADELTKINLDDLRLAGRLWAYSESSASDMIDPDGLPEQTVVKGISAFEDLVENQPLRTWETDENYDYVVSTAGPTIIRSS
jgi:hypothetical protein